VRAAGVVDVQDRNGVAGGLADPVPVRVFLRQTPLTRPCADIRAVADATAGQPSIGRLHAIMAAIRDRVDYTPGSTDAVTTAAEALARGAGVCQDHAHIFITCARAAGIPARYITGYLLLDGDAQADAHHAWAEAWVEGLGWVGFDAANRLCPTDRYVRLAAALDAYHAAPVRGARRSQDGESLAVEVKVRRQAMTQSQSQQ
jgi:transglutaminase-like putative cysteine protease